VRILRQHVSNRELVFILGEGFLIFCAVFLASSLFSLPGMSPYELFLVTWPKALLVAFVVQFSLYFNDLYEVHVSESTLELATHMLQAIGMTSIALAAIYFLWPGAIIGRWVFFLSLVFLIGFLVSWRFLYLVVIRRRMFTTKALIVGAGELASDLLTAVNQRKHLSYDILGVISSPGEKTKIREENGIPVRSGFEGLCDRARAQEASSIIVALDDKRGFMPYKELLSCKVQGISVIDGESFYERITGKLLVDKINPSWLIFSDGFRKSVLSRLLKRMVGLLIATVMVVLLLPLMAVVAAIIKLESSGPVIFSQERVGENGRTFMLHKFRSMREDAEEATGPVWASEDDPRITRVGEVIRKLRIDELPQLWNVLKGEMSFVGPRPERPFFVERLRKIVPYYDERFSVKPGLTGWAQVMYAYGASEEDAIEKLKYDLYYIKNMSLVLDLVVIFHTVKIVLLGRGSR